MKTSAFRTFAILAAAGLTLTVAGCGGKKTKLDKSYVARDVDTLYSLAKEKLDRQEYKLAGALFDEVERQHPYSVWARRAELMSAFSYYLARDYTESTNSAQRFLSIHPGNKDAPYAYYIVAVNYYEQIADVTRDQRITQQALDALGEVIRRYPESTYAADAKLKVDLVRDHLAGKEMEIGRFYQNRGQWLAATIRFRSVVDKYDTTSHVPEALERLTECYMALGIPEEAHKAAAVLGNNYPGSVWYQRAYALAQNGAMPLGLRDPKSAKHKKSKKA
jgi:outer membrane protein assembly factor BamD